jgi:membrane dipeptidase
MPNSTEPPTPNSRPLLIDGLNVSEPSRPVFEAMARAGVTAANYTCTGVWSGFEESLRDLLGWQRLLVEHQDLLMPVLDVRDIERARSEQRVGIILGWQNTGGFDDYLPYVSMFHQLGLRVAQLTYNTANAVGSGCYESNDGGLTDFGADLVAELNRVGILIDLSHAGPVTAAQTIEASAVPVAYTHCLPAALKEHPRNKSDEELGHIAAHGGFCGATFYPSFLRRGGESTVDDYLEALEHMLEIVGHDRVGIGTDFTEGRPPEFWEYIGRDKGYGRVVVTGRARRKPEAQPLGLRSNEDIGALPEAMRRRGWDDTLIVGVLGANWLRFLGAIWGGATPADGHARN